MNGPLYKQANSNVVLVRRVKRKNEGPLKQLTRWFVNNQIGTSRKLQSPPQPLRQALTTT
jgi:very-long-chain ceramide synthase